MHTCTCLPTRRNPFPGVPAGRSFRRSISVLLLLPLVAFAAACGDSITSPDGDVGVMPDRADAVTVTALRPQLAHGIGVVSNGSFEDTPDFTGWTSTSPASFQWMVSGAGVGGLFEMAQTQPQDGAKVAWNAFDNGTFSLSQDVDLPLSACQLELEWSDRFQWVALFPPSLPKQAVVEIEDLAGVVPAATLFSFSSDTVPPVSPVPFPRFDTGWQTHTADISAFGGSSVRVTFRQVAEAAVGALPVLGQFELDHVAVVTGGGGSEPSAALTPVGDKSLKHNKGLFTVEFSCAGGCGGESTAVATLNGIPVENGQVVDLRLKSNKPQKSAKSKKSKKSKKPLRIEGASFELVVECLDASGNPVATATASPVFAEKSKKSGKSKKKP